MKSLLVLELSMIGALMALGGSVLPYSTWGGVGFIASGVAILGGTLAGALKGGGDAA